MIQAPRPAPAVPGVSTLVKLQLGSLGRRPMTWILVAVLTAYLLLVYGAYLLLLAAPASEALDPDLLIQPMRAGGLTYIAQLFAGIASILVIVFASSVVGHEFSRGTLRTLLLMRVRRGRFATATIVMLLLACAALTVLGVAVTLLAGWAFGAAAGEDLLRLHGPGHTAVAVLSIAGRTFIQYTVWALLAFSVTLLTRSLLAGIGGTLALQILGSVAAALIGSLGDVGTWASRLLVNTAVDRITVPPRLELSGSDIAWVAANLVLWLALPAWWATRRLLRMDALAATRGG